MACWGATMATDLAFDWINPVNLHHVWPRIREGLEKVRANTSENWLPEDIYAAIKAGISHLHVGMLGERYEGFIVTTPSVAADGPVLHIWACYSAADIGLLDDGIEQIETWAVAMNAKRITFHSPRKGWDKAGEKIGFRPVSTIYAKEVNP